MKIVLYSLPRSATKHTQNMFQSYLLAAGGPVLAKNKIDGIGEPFFYNDSDQYYKMASQELIEINDDGLVFKELVYKRLVMHDKILRAKMLLESDNGWVLKMVPNNRYDHIKYDMIMYSDLCVAITRDDIFEHVLSFCLAKQINIWSRNEIEASDAIGRYTSEPVSIDVDFFTKTYKWFDGYRKIKWSKDVTVVKFEEITKITSDRDFCNIFNIEYVPFEYTNYPVEYADNKFKMISNLEEVSGLYKELSGKNDCG